ncbi:MAG: hypothetical protein RLY20_1737 [Verrucomicrobiota bacterium]|jgi:hypothetical protein
MSYPLVYQINTRCWLRELSASTGRALALADVPTTEFAGWRERGFTHVWLMGVWTSGPKAKKVALSEAINRRVYSEVLRDWREEDVAGSPYAISEYTVAVELGGDAALAAFRAKLNEAGIKLILDFVPNHVGIDHRWIRERTELFVQSAKQMPETFPVQRAIGTRWIAHGRDPNFPAWTDTAQLDYRNPDTRAAMIEQLLLVADRCDGVRCDMAMLLLNEVFARHWAKYPFTDAIPDREFWTDAIAAVWKKHSNFLFVAEAYWGLESALQTLGFDFTYDKVLYDELVYHDPSAVTRHLYEESSAAFVENSVHFLENHDEHRAAGIFILPEHRVAALLVLGLPGMRLIHERQLTGARIRTPVQLMRRPVELVNEEVRRLYDQLLRAIRDSAVGRGRATLLRPRAAWSDNQTWRNFVIVQWQVQPEAFDIVVVNLVPHRCQCYVPLTIPNLASHHWSMRDLLGTERYLRVGADLERQGLYLDVPAYAAQIYRFQPSS